MIRSSSQPARSRSPWPGGTLAIVIGVLWYTSALWYYNGYQLPHL